MASWLAGNRPHSTYDFFLDACHFSLFCWSGGEGKGKGKVAEFWTNQQRCLRETLFDGNGPCAPSICVGALAV